MKYINTIQNKKLLFSAKDIYITDIIIAYKNQWLKNITIPSLDTSIGTNLIASSTSIKLLELY